MTTLRRFCDTVGWPRLRRWSEAIDRVKSLEATAGAMPATWFSGGEVSVTQIIEVARRETGYIDPVFRSDFLPDPQGWAQSVEHYGHDTLPEEWRAIQFTCSFQRRPPWPATGAEVDYWTSAAEANALMNSLLDWHKKLAVWRAERENGWTLKNLEDHLGVDPGPGGSPFWLRLADRLGLTLEFQSRPPGFGAFLTREDGDRLVAAHEARDRR